MDDEDKKFNLFATGMSVLLHCNILQYIKPYKSENIFGRVVLIAERWKC